MSTITVTKEQAHKLAYVFAARHMNHGAFMARIMRGDDRKHSVENVELIDYKQDGDELSVVARVTACYRGGEPQTTISRIRFEIDQFCNFIEKEHHWHERVMPSDTLSWVMLDAINEFQIPSLIETSSERNDNAFENLL